MPNQLQAQNFSDHIAQRISRFELGLCLADSATDTSGRAYTLLDFGPKDIQPSDPEYSALMLSIEQGQLTPKMRERWNYRLINTCRFMLSLSDFKAKHLLIINGIKGNAERRQVSGGGTFITRSDIPPNAKIAAAIPLSRYSNSDSGIQALSSKIVAELKTINSASDWSSTGQSSVSDQSIQWVALSLETTSPSQLAHCPFEVVDSEGKVVTVGHVHSDGMAYIPGLQSERYTLSLMAKAV